jgi:hypothetical protein
MMNMMTRNEGSHLIRAAIAMLGSLRPDKIEVVIERKPAFPSAEQMETMRLEIKKQMEYSEWVDIGRLPEQGKFYDQFTTTRKNGK